MMKSLLGIITVLSGFGLIVGIIYFVQGYGGVITGTGIIGLFLLPFVASLGFYKVVDLLEKQAEKRETWSEAMNYNLLKIRKKYLKEE